jgi:hypothetical protein
VIEVIVAPDTVKLLCDYLRDELDDRGYTDIHVGVEVPTSRPDRFVRLRRTGGTKLNLVVDDAQVTVEAWGESPAVAHDLAQMCRALIHAADSEELGGVQVYRIAEVAGPADLPDPVSDQSRYSATYLVAVRCAAA